jgi:hypothetical protein
VSRAPTGSIGAQRPVLSAGGGSGGIANRTAGADQGGTGSLGRRPQDDPLSERPCEARERTPALSRSMRCLSHLPAFPETLNCPALSRILRLFSHVPAHSRDFDASRIFQHIPETSYHLKLCSACRSQRGCSHPPLVEACNASRKFPHILGLLARSSIF